MYDNGSYKIRVGISSCLLGQKVRFDGNHKQQRLITETLAKKFEFIAVCPEVAIGLGIPRTPIHLVGNKNSQRAVNIRDESIDVTAQLANFGRQKATELHDISGYIFKKGSPSCGLHNVKIYKDKDKVIHSGRGVYAKQITEAIPLLPVEEEGRLNDAKLRNNFLQRVEVYFRWQQLIKKGLTKERLIDFHTSHKFILLAHCEVIYRELGRLIARLGKNDLEASSEQYIKLLLSGLEKPSSRGKHSNVMEHIAGFLKHHLDVDDKQEMQNLIANYRSGILPRIVPVTLLNHYLRRFPNQYLLRQHYLTTA